MLFSARRSLVFVLAVAAFSGLVFLHRRYDAPHPKPVVPVKVFDGSLPFETWAARGVHAVEDFRFADDAQSPAEWTAFADTVLPAAHPSWIARLDSLLTKKPDPVAEKACAFTEPIGPVFRDSCGIFVRGCDEKTVSLTLSTPDAKDATERVFEVVGGKRQRFPDTAKLERGTTYRLNARTADGGAFDVHFRTATEDEELNDKKCARLQSIYVPHSETRRFAAAAAALARGFDDTAAQILETRAPKPEAEIGVLEMQAYLFDRSGRFKERDAALDRLRAAR